MRILLLIPAIAFSILSLGQIPEGVYGNSVVDFVYEHLGEKVGKGVCFDLVVQAHGGKKFLKKWDNKSKYKIAYVSGYKRKGIEEIQPGDVMLCGTYHIGVVLEINGDRITFAHQNVGNGKENQVRAYGKKIGVVEDSSVIISYLLLAEKNKTFSFYRFN